jgi:hypothetical protein
MAAQTVLCAKPAFSEPKSAFFDAFQPNFGLETGSTTPT